MYISYRKEKGRDKMSNYFDNQQKWSFNVTPGESVFVTTDHGDHTHTLDIYRMFYMKPSWHSFRLKR